MPASKETRVRRLGFWKIMARVLPANLFRYSAGFFLTDAAVSRTSLTSSGERSFMDARLRPFNGLLIGQCSSTYSINGIGWSGSGKDGTGIIIRPEAGHRRRVS